MLVEELADHWKTCVDQRLTTPLESPGAMTVFQSQPNEHLSLARHLTSERKVEEFIAGKGVVTRWERVRKQNHWLDALYNACAAGSLAGGRLIEEPRPSAPRPARRDEAPLRPDGRPYIDMEGWREMMGRWHG